MAALPTELPAPSGAWAPAHLTIQIPFTGGIELTTPQAPEMQLIDRRHLLVVCPGSWSPRTLATKRQHLAITVADRLILTMFDTPVGGPGVAMAHTTLTPRDLATQAVIDAAQQAASRTPDLLALHGLALAVIGYTATLLEQAPTSVIDAVESYLRDHCHEALARDTVANHFNLSGDHLNRLIRADRGQTFVGLLKRHRVQRAKEHLLVHDAADLATVAAACGFGSASYLIRVFRELVGCTPAAWRQHVTSGAG